MVVWLVILIIGLVAFLVVSIVWSVRAHRQQVDAGWEELIGKTAEVRVPLKPRGSVLIEGELWTAISEAGNIDAGQEVTITRVDGLVLYVTKK